MPLEDFDKHVTGKLVPYVVSQYNTTTKVMATLDQLFSNIISAVGKTNAQEVLKKSCRSFLIQFNENVLTKSHTRMLNVGFHCIPIFTVFTSESCVFCVQYSRLHVKNVQTALMLHNIESIGIRLETNFSLNCGNGEERQQCFSDKESN